MRGTIQSGSIVDAVRLQDNEISNITNRLFVCQYARTNFTRHRRESSESRERGSHMPTRMSKSIANRHRSFGFTARDIYEVSYSLVSWQAARSRTSMIWSTHCIFWECESVSGSLSLAWYCKCKFTMRLVWAHFLRRSVYNHTRDPV